MIVPSEYAGANINNSRQNYKPIENDSLLVARNCPLHQSCAATRSCRCAIPAAAVCSTPMSPAVREELRFTASFAWIDVLLMVLAGCTGLTGRCGAGKSRGRSVMAFAAAQNRPR